MARVRVALRDRRRPQEETRISCDGIVLDCDLHTAAYGGKTAKLTRTECAIAKILLTNKDRVVAKVQPGSGCQNFQQSLK